MINSSMDGAQVKQVNCLEIERISNLVVIDPYYKEFLMDDIELISSNPKLYWNSFCLDLREKGDEERILLILEMQKIYSKSELVQLTLF